MGLVPSGTNCSQLQKEIPAPPPPSQTEDTLAANFQEVSSVPGALRGYLLKVKAEHRAYINGGRFLCF